MSPPSRVSGCRSPTRSGGSWTTSAAGSGRSRRSRPWPRPASASSGPSSGCSPSTGWSIPPAGPPGPLRAGRLACAVVPYAFHRWVWRQRRPDQLARLLARKHPRIGDQLLGVIELAHDRSEQARSRRLVEAAIEQVAFDSQKRDFRDAVPAPRHRPGWRPWSSRRAIARRCSSICPDAASNAWARLVGPWTNTPRYTFAALERCPPGIVVAHGEPFRVRGEVDRGHRLAPGQGRGPRRRSPADRRDAGQTGATSSSSRRRWRPRARSPRRRRDAGGRGRADAPPRTQRDRRARDAARVPRPARARRARMPAAGRSAWSRGAGPSSPPRRARDLAAAWVDGFPVPRGGDRRPAPRSPWMAHATSSFAGRIGSAWRARTRSP